MMRGDNLIPLSENHRLVLATMATGVLPDPGGLRDQDADFVDHLHRVRGHMASEMARKRKDRRTVIG